VSGEEEKGGKGKERRHTLPTIISELDLGARTSEGRKQGSKEARKQGREKEGRERRSAQTQQPQHVV
jgi:hypothetical protein